MRSAVAVEDCADRVGGHVVDILILASLSRNLVDPVDHALSVFVQRDMLLQFELIRHRECCESQIFKGVLVGIGPGPISESHDVICNVARIPIPYGIEEEADVLIADPRVEHASRQRCLVLEGESVPHLDDVADLHVAEATPVLGQGRLRRQRPTDACDCAHDIQAHRDEKSDGRPSDATARDGSTESGHMRSRVGHSVLLVRFSCVCTSI